MVPTKKNKNQPSLTVRELVNIIEALLNAELNDQEGKQVE